MLSLLPCCLAVAMCVANVALAKEVSEEFKIVPGKPGDLSVALDTPPIDSSTCRFEWDSNGATVEVSHQVTS